VFQAWQSGTVICTDVSAARAVCQAPGTQANRLTNMMAKVIIFTFMDDSLLPLNIIYALSTNNAKI
jgi:hypothetical protein